ncbi:Fic family protein [Arthrobacter sp. B10-11]|uniref:Fic family protein n=1 Tax=Arthrobacter sp. B10-11 TaxID=3081160 RepID=UPI0029558722|nr:Fic family protein [Arthrobacter sp. B10-11]MDV8149723.1 Fic family protein [Arthrobacter sp. B10-11]
MSPGYDSTPVDPEDATAFVDGVSFDTKLQVYEAEANAISAVQAEMMSAIGEGAVTAIDLSTHGILESLHKNCYSPIWKWAGKIRTREVTIGVAPEQIREQLAAEVGNIRFWVEQDQMDPGWVAMTAHHRLVKVHPFVDGNGRITRLFADLLLFSLTLRYTFDWQPALESHLYFEGLREADRILDVGTLLDTVGLIDLEG